MPKAGRLRFRQGELVPRGGGGGGAVASNTAKETRDHVDRGAVDDVAFFHRAVVLERAARVHEAEAIDWDVIPTTATPIVEAVEKPTQLGDSRAFEYVTYGDRAHVHYVEDDLDGAKRRGHGCDCGGKSAPESVKPRGLALVDLALVDPESASSLSEHVVEP